MARWLIIAWTFIAAVYASTQNNCGRDFVLGFMQHTNPTEDAYINITTSVETDVRVSVTGPHFAEANLNETFVVRRGVVETVIISYKLRGSDGHIESKAVHITASDEIIVYATHGKDSIYNYFVAHPTNVLGTEYLLYVGMGSYVSNLIVGLEDFTTVNISYVKDDGPSHAFSDELIADVQIVINRYDIYQFPSTATYMRGDNVFAVFGRQRSISANFGVETVYLVDQVLPVPSLGRRFICNTYPANRLSYYKCGFFSNEYYDITINTAHYVWSSTNRLGWTWAYGDRSSPMYIESTTAGVASEFFGISTARRKSSYPMFKVPSMEQYTSEYDFMVIAGWPFTNYLIVNIGLQELEGLTLDGTTFPSNSVCAIVKGTETYACRTQIGEGVHTIRHEDPNVVFGCSVLGFSADDIYIMEAPINASPGDTCISTTCMNGGTRIDNGTESSCQCSADYTGTFCEATIYSPGAVSVLPDQMYVNGQHTVVFRCQFFTLEGYLYKIRWYKNDVLVIESSILNSSEVGESVVSDDDFIDQGHSFLDTDVKIQCEANVYPDRDGDSLESSKSDIFQVIELDEIPTEMEKGQNVVIPVKLNIPFGCSVNSSTCDLVFKLYDPDYSHGQLSIAVKSKTTCGIQLETDTLNQTSISTFSGNIVITTINDLKFKRETLLRLKMKINATGDVKRYWNAGALSATMPLKVKEREWRRGKRCYSHVDPHMCTCDNKRYENQNEDVFVLYKNKKQNTEIQTKTKPCNRNRARCSCSCTMKAGGDMFMINHCNEHKTQYLVAKDQALRVYQRGSNSYKVEFPDGTRVMIRVLPYYDYTMNIDIYPNLGDTNQVEGLCGNCNGDQSDDFQLPGGSNVTDEYQFSMAWSLLSTNRRSEQLQYSNMIQATTASDTDASYCICPNERQGNNGQAVCRVHKDDIHDRPVQSGEKLLEIKAKPYRYPEENIPLADEEGGHRVGKRQTSSLTNTEAKLLCYEEFQKSPVYENRNEIPDIDFGPFIEECAIDVQLTGDKEWAIPHADAFLDFFLMQLELDEELHVDDEIQQKIKNNTCYSRCGGHGTCVNGSCVCDEGYGSELCLLRLDIPPVLNEFSFDGLCHTARGDDCSSISVSGDGFVEQPFCKMEIQQVNTEGYFVSMETITIDCVSINFNEIEFSTSVRRKRRSIQESTTVAAAERIGIAVSNNGLNFSDFQYVIILNSTCINLTQDGNGVQYILPQTGFCYIDGSCISNGTTYDCNKCDPLLAQFSWTNVCIDSDGEAYFHFLLVGIGVVIAFVLAALLVVKIKRRFSPLQSSSIHIQVHPHNNPVYDFKG